MSLPRLCTIRDVLDVVMMTMVDPTRELPVRIELLCIDWKQAA